MDLYDEYAEHHGDPMLTLFEIQGDKDIEPSLRIRAATDLLPYRYPKRKAIELTVEEEREEGHSIIQEEIEARIRDLIGPDWDSETDTEPNS